MRGWDYGVSEALLALTVLTCSSLNNGQLDGSGSNGVDSSISPVLEASDGLGLGKRRLEFCL